MTNHSVKNSTSGYFFSIVRLLTPYLIIAVLGFSCADREEVKPDIKAAMLNSINLLRTEGCRCGLEEMPPVLPVKWNTYLEAAALRHVTDMEDRSYLDHISPEGTSPAQRAMEAGYEGHDVGENIARGYSTIEEVIKGWQNSEAHCKAMMGELYSEIGAAKQGSYWVLDLGNGN